MVITNNSPRPTTYSPILKLLMPPEWRGCCVYSIQTLSSVFSRGGSAPADSGRSIRTAQTCGEPSSDACGVEESGTAAGGDGLRGGAGRWRNRQCHAKCGGPFSEMGRPEGYASNHAARI